MEGPASAMMGTLQATFPLSCLGAPVSTRHRAKPQPPAIPTVHTLPTQGQQPLSPSVSGGARLPLWVLASLPSHTWAYRMGALSVPTAPMHLLSSASAQVLLPSEPCLLAARC